MSQENERPVRVINAHAPIRICDNGGWTDTWFARYGKIFNIAVHPSVEVQVKVFERDAGPERITLSAENYSEKYTISKPNGRYSKQPLLEAAIDYMDIPAGLAIEVAIHSEAPGGCSTGTSAAVCVALIGALDQLTPGRMAPHQVALAAHRVETELLRQQSGIQDQIASAYGGINYIEMTDFPKASVSQIRVQDSILWELESRLSLIYLGVAHSSSEVHQMVIGELESVGPESRKLQPLRQTAEKSKNALYSGDLTALGQSMIENTEAQRNLHDGLVGPSHQAIIEIAASHGAVGWKVNGAGGDGGSVTLLSAPDLAVKRTMLREIQAASAGFQNIPIRLSRSGLRLWETH